MKRNELVWGTLMVLAGMLLLGQSLGLLGTAAETIWALLFAVTGAAFLAVYRSDRGHWWPLIPGFVFFSLATLIGLSAMAPAFAATWGGAIILGGIGLGFWTVYATHPTQWWAIIPAGVLTTLAVVTGVDQALPGQDNAGGIFFLGLAATFGLVYLLPTPPNRMRWALIPSGILGVIGVAIQAASAAALMYVGPAMLILAGIYLLVHTRGARAVPPAAEEPTPTYSTVEEPTPSYKQERYDEPTLPQPR